MEIFSWDLFYIIILIILSFIIWHYIFIFYSSNQMKIFNKILKKKKEKENNLSQTHQKDLLPYSIALYKESNSLFQSNNCMIHIMPQNYHFFIEDNKLIYQPIILNINNYQKQCCDQSSKYPDLAYILSVENTSISLITPIKKIMCRKSLNYLKEKVYTIVTYRLQTYHLKNPMTLLYHLHLNGKINLKKND